MQKVKHGETIVELQNVCFAYLRDEVIKNVTLEIHRGDYVGIIGPNGGGKSTLLKLMLKLLTARSGKVRLFGTDIGSFRDWSKIGYVPQNSHDAGDFPVTVAEMVLMGRYGRMGLFRRPSRNDFKKAEIALNHVDLFEFKDHQMSMLSGGQKQRVFIARALVQEPEIIFLDEPTVGVDVKTQKQFYALLRKLNRTLGLTLILASHELDVVAHESTELGYINRTLEYYGEPTEFLKGAYFHELIGFGGVHH